MNTDCIEAISYKLRCHDSPIRRVTKKVQVVKMRVVVITFIFTKLPFVCRVNFENSFALVNFLPTPIKPDKHPEDVVRLAAIKLNRDEW